MDSNPLCPKCQLPVLANFYFCPNCGKSLRPKSLSTSIGKQIGIYLLSLLLPPLGLWPGFKYLFQKETKAKIVGVAALVLTIVSILITVNLTRSLFNQINTQLQQSIPQLNQLPQ